MSVDYIEFYMLHEMLSLILIKVLCDKIMNFCVALLRDFLLRQKLMVF
jgi:hypothetical protein